MSLRATLAALLLLALTGCGALTSTVEWTCPSLWVPHHYDDRTELVCEATGKRVILRSEQAQQ